MPPMAADPESERERTEPDLGTSLFSLAASDPRGELVDRSGLADEDVAQIDAVMAALVRLRAAEKALAEASLRYMELGETDMRALHVLIVAGNRGTPATPGSLARALGISTASTTKLLDRLERAGHVRREPHPTDRRATVLAVEPSTRAAALRTVGAQQARRVEAARRLAPGERRVVIDFLEDMAQRLSMDGVDWAESAED